MLSVQTKIKPKYNKNKQLIIVAGPTAIGKTAMSIELAQFYKCPIISFDSRQFYKELSIGTAKPSAAELAMATHHFIDSHTIEKEYTAGIYEKEALALLDQIFKTNDVCIAVGGSGLYIDALVYGIDAMPKNAAIKEKWIQTHRTEGLKPLQDYLNEHNPEVFEFINKNNHARMIRAIEVIEVSGNKFTAYRKSTAQARNFTPIWIGLNTDRAILYNRINERVDIMMEKGLEEEVKSLIPFRFHTALKTVGYVEFFDYFEGIIPIEKSIELIKRNSRRYAKRQLTWFKKNTAIEWFEPQKKGDILQYIQNVKKELL
ncbi:tRNA (adenosine(37)-N6)-dimethylallyltransferase MiaA [Putridiphycobacter roseus]|uniref:tRNA dimethylallyltransferase n=1 Tax=Putridiphycobacter roseus TaxID=2219161 RepID=A0A2W1N0L4_9FLAO|nr:tRNA (adenosine(37)-N6)-dimethylallyltransferase MiaA [Putridiphycobacter roseus]PZE17767.1 tRNA (adenosine(37)-N6)-dimethylallyltransferase MiaA [Putridiphycobacter roseus]